MTLAPSRPVTAHEMDDGKLADHLHATMARVRVELGRRIVGQEQVVEQSLLALLAGGNCLLIGVPGLAKTLLVQSLAEVFDLRFSRIQFTPDLMPSDVTGTDVIQEDPATGRRKLVFVPGPIFANLVLADEINRTPPKTQAALLEAMQEHRVTVQGQTYPLDPPFHVFATRNPIELEGTYPLPEAQLDRFLFEVVLDYLPEEDEVRVARETTTREETPLDRIVGGAELIAFQKLVRRVPVADPLVRYAVELARISRPVTPGAPEAVRRWIAYGASVRAAQALLLGAKARALLEGRPHATTADIRSLARPVFRHRLLLNFQAQAERITADQVVEELLNAAPPPRSGL
ncbi:MAG TPA: MoxR family ATPase [Gemmatimonadales bacterium]|nr:MoxR family ATPase [Gemmatimonadales bacterium]